MERAFKVLITGRVQGVGYRYFARREAVKSGIHGYVKNLPDGRVEVLAEGEETILLSFINTLRSGPGYGYVTDLDIIPVTFENSFSSFDIEY